MSRPSALRTFTIRLAMLAVLFGACAPWVSAAIAVGRGAGFVEVCSRLGTKWVSAAEADTGAHASTPDHLHPLANCPFCAHHLDAIVPPEPTLAVAAVATVVRDVPRRFLSAPRTPYAWACARPRGPPAAA